MKIKKYVVDEMQEAVKQIKEDLGPDALIVSSQKVRGKGIMGILQRKIEVTAVLDEANNEAVLEYSEVKELPKPQPEKAKAEQIAERPIQQPQQPKSTAIDAERTVEDEVNPVVHQAADLVRSKPRAKKASKAAKYTPENLPPTEFKPLLEDAVMKSIEQQEKERFLAMLEKQLDKMDKVKDKDFARRWLRTLTDMDVDQGIAEKLLSGLEEVAPKGAGDQDDMAKVALVNRVTDLLKPAYEGSKKTKFMAFVGPPGVGKTTTLAKLATRFKLLENKKVALITVYTYRYGTADQLKIYGDAIDVPVEVVMTPAELRQAVERHADKDYVLIDTVGRSSKNTGQVLELKGFLEAINGAKQTYLVMSANTKDRDLFRTIKDFKIAHYSGYIFTKVDETETLGSMLNVVLKTGIPVSYYTDGQTIPDDIEDAQPRKLAQLIFRSVDPYEGDN
ncbi:MAG: flagellar biosynthesis protein FlhF [Firmicutes bacterium]|nr:flagellar biosynthesis protein FlhF [Bacillota bacterium]